MKADRFFPMAYDIRHNPKIEILRTMGGLRYFGMWVCLMGILYDSDGVIDLSKPGRIDLLARELETDFDGITDFLNTCADAELIDAALLEEGRVLSGGICKELDYYRAKSEAGKKSGESRRKKSVANRKTNN